MSALLIEKINQDNLHKYYDKKMLINDNTCADATKAFSNTSIKYAHYTFPGGNISTKRTLISLCY